MQGYMETEERKKCEPDVMKDIEHIEKILKENIKVVEKTG